MAARRSAADGCRLCPIGRCVQAVAPGGTLIDSCPHMARFRHLARERGAKVLTGQTNESRRPRPPAFVCCR